MIKVSKNTETALSLIRKLALLENEVIKFYKSDEEVNAMVDAFKSAEDFLTSKLYETIGKEIVDSAFISL